MEEVRNTNNRIRIKTLHLIKEMGKKRNRSESFTKSGVTDGGKRSDDGDSQEEFDIEAGLSKLNNGVRCSARVIEKQEKLRRESSPAKQAVVSSLDQSSINQQHQPLNPVVKNLFASPSSSNVASGDPISFSDSYWDQASPAPDVPNSRAELAETEGWNSCTTTTSFDNKRGTIDEKRKKRNWEVWSQDDKLHFFEALNEFGKDFDAIQNHLASKQKSRSRLALSATSFVPKNKDQVRHFYYRTWHKIAKHLKFPKDMKRANQELYGLVNYGELRKKQRVLNVKSAAKLSELMEKGMTTIKVRGKTYRVKTPVCRAIKRMNLLDDEHSRVPCKICLELTAKDRQAWSIVQSVAHNPRVCVLAPPQRTLSSVINYFEERWKTPEERLKEQFVHNFGKKRTPRLRFFPIQQDTRTPIFKMSESTNSAMISLRSYTEKVLHKPTKDPEPDGSHSKTKMRRKQSGNHSDSHGEPDFSDQDVGDGPKYFVKTRTTSDFEDKTEESGSEQNMDTPVQPIYATGSRRDDNILSSPNARLQSDEKAIAEMTKNENLCNCSPPPKLHVRDRESEDIVGHIWDDETIKQGWSAPEAGLMTIGELYLMLGRCQRLSFNYSWDNDESEKEPKLVDKLLEVARALRKRKSMRTKSYNSYGASSACVKCGFQSDQFVPTTVVNDHRIPESTPQTPTTVPQAAQANSPATSRVEPGTSSYASTSMNVAPNIQPTIPVEIPIQMANQPPPKPFMDLTKGNRRISRINSRRTIGSRLPFHLQPEQNPPLPPQTGTPNSPFDCTGNELSVYSRMFPNARESNQDAEVPRPISTVPSCQIPISSSEFENLLQDKSGDKNVDPDNTFSLSSFMDISLPESTRLVADDVSLNVDKLLDENTASSLGLPGTSAGGKSSGLETPKKSLDGDDISLEAVRREQRQSATETWIPDTSELSFTNLLTTFELANSRTDNQQGDEEDVTFHSVVGEASYVTTFTETPDV